MKTLITATKVMLLMAFITGAPALFAQEKSESQKEHKYSLHLVKDENGKEEVINKTFASRAEMDNYIKENKIDVPETAELPELQATPETQAPPVKQIIIEKKIEKHNSKIKSDGKREKKIIIIEKEEGGIDGKVKLEITCNDLSAEERLMVIQTILDLNIQGKKVEMIKAGKDAGINQPGPLGIDKMQTASETNISDVKLFPNPSGGEVHLSFKVEKPVDVKLRITDLEGKEVYASALNNFSGNFDRDIYPSVLAKGTYLLDVIAGAEKKTTKVVMQ